MRMLRTNQSKFSLYHAIRVTVSRNVFFSWCSEKNKHFFDVDIVVVKKKHKNVKIRNVVYRGLYSYRRRVSIITFFPKVHAERDCKSF